MNINVSTRFGDVVLQSCYDVSIGDAYYTAYDEAGNCLGELWNMPYYDEEDSDIDEIFTVAVETAIDGGDIAIPSFNKENNKPAEAYVVTICEKFDDSINAQSFLFNTMDKARECKQDSITAWIETMVEHKLRYDVKDLDVVCEGTTEDNSKYLCITIRLAKID